MPTPEQIVEAWHGAKSAWITRRNKLNDPGKQWEVVRDVDGRLQVSDPLRQPGNGRTREAKALDDIARGEAVLKLIEKRNAPVETCSDQGVGDCADA